MRQGDYDPNQNTLLKDALHTVTDVVTRRPKITLWAVVLLACASIGLTIAYVEFKTERSDLIDPRADFQQRWTEYTETFGDASDIIAVVEADDPATVRMAVDALGSRMAREPEVFSNVLYKLDAGPLREKGLQYLSPQQLQAGLRRLDSLDPVLRGNWHLLGLETLIYRLDQQLATLPTNSTSAQRRPLLERADRLGASLVRTLEEPKQFTSPWPEVVTIDRGIYNASGQSVYLTSDDGRLGFIKAFPAGSDRSFDDETKTIDRLRELIADVKAEHPEAKIGLTGIPVLENDEMRRSQIDMLKASAISFVGVGLLLFAGFRGFRHPALALIMLLIGMAWAFGFTTLAIGHLNILSVSFAVILIGLGIDFAIHYLERYLELRHRGRHLQPALLETSGCVGPGIVTAAITTALAFLCAVLTQFLGVAELGIIAGGGIILCAAATFIVLPALIAMSDEDVEPSRLPTPFKGDWLRKATSRFPVIVTAVTALLIVVIGCQTIGLDNDRLELKIGYDYNLLNLQADGMESVELQKRIFQDADNSLLFAVSIADSPEEAQRLRARYLALPSVSRVEDMASRVPGRTSEASRQLIRQFRARLSYLPRQPGRLPNADPASIGRALERLYGRLRNVPDVLADKSADSINSFLDQFESYTLGDQIQFLDGYQQRTARTLLTQLHVLAASTNTQPISFAELPRELKSRYISSEGKWLLQVYPKDEIWDREPLEKFVNDVRSVDPEVTGTPLQNYEASRQIKASYESAAVYAFAVIFLVLLFDFLRKEHKLLTLLPPLAIVGFVYMSLESRQSGTSVLWLVIWYAAMAATVAAVLDFRNLRDTLLAMLPPVGGGLLMFGMLALLGVDMNPANLIVLPLVLGIGVDDGVHVVHDFRMQNNGYRTSSSTMNAIVLTSFTSMIGFGSMMVAAHRGLYSVGLVLVIGVGSCLFVSLVTLPAILTLISGRAENKAGGENEQQGGNRKQQDQQRMARAA